MLERDEITRANETAWDRVAEKYQLEVERDVATLRAGQVTLHAHEVRLLGDLSGCQRAIHLQCSHGQDALSLLNLGVREVVGVDISREALAVAAQKTAQLDAAAAWVCADVLAVPETFDGQADLVYTGQGALNWVFDLERWAGVIARLLRPGGRFFIYEGHPLNWVWQEEATSHVPGRNGYFAAQARPNEGFPASAIARFTPAGETVPTAWERNWTMGQIVSALAGAGLLIERLEEYPEHFWPQFPNISEPEMGLLPHSFSLLARRTRG